MAQAQRYKLKLSKLQFCSLVDEPAQPNAKTLLIKRKGASDDIMATARLAKVNDELGLAFFWAFTSTNKDGSDHYDLQGDQVTEFIKAAMDYMTETGGAVDVMHNGVAGDDRVVFAMPMDPEIGAAYGYVGKQTGLMVAVKPTAENLAKLKSGELNGVSIGGLGERVPVGKKTAPIAKEAVLTSSDAGHAHTISLDDPARYWCDQLQTSYQTAEGADCGHSHAWVFDAKTGTITIADDSGHGHTIDAVVPPDVLALYAVREAQRDAQNLAEAATPALIADADSDGIPMAVPVEESSGSARIVVINARAPQNKSTPRSAMPHGGLNTEKSQMDKDKQIADLTAKTAELEKRAGALSKMSAVAFAVYKSLTGQDADAFLAKSSAEQDAAAADIAKRNEEADKVVYVSKSTGDVYRAKDDARLVEMAKRMDAQATEIKKAAIRKTAAEVLGKKAPGDDETHDFIVEQLSGNEKAMECLKGLVASSKIGKGAPGIGGSDVPAAGDADGALEQLEKGLTEFCKAQNIPVAKAWTSGLPAFTQTEKGAQLKRAYDESLAG